jgi:transposase InsO family protein
MVSPYRRQSASVKAPATIMPDNGKAERFVQTTLREWAYAQAYPSSDHRAVALPGWLHRYNWHRPHGGIKSQTPISRLGLTEDNLLRLHS